jgi:hypothetical protein
MLITGNKARVSYFRIWLTKLYPKERKVEQGFEIAVCFEEDNVPSTSVMEELSHLLYTHISNSFCRTSALLSELLKSHNANILYF